MVNSEDLQDLKILLALLPMDERLYTCIINKIKNILSSYVECKYVSSDAIDYQDLKLKLELDLKVGLSFANKKPQPPYLSSFSSDKERYRTECLDRFNKSLCTIYQMDYLYGILSNDSNINWDFVYSKM